MVLITLIKTKNSHSAVTDEHSLQPLKSQPKLIHSKHRQEWNMQYQSRGIKVASVRRIYGL